MAHPADVIERLLTAYGFGRQDIANLCKVSSRVATEWRKDHETILEEDDPLSELSDFVDELEREYGVECPATWLMCPFEDLGDGYSLAPSHLYIAERVELLRSYLRKQISVAWMLDLWQPEWRNKHYSKMRTFIAADGLPAITAGNCPTCGASGWAAMQGQPCHLAEHELAN